MILNQIFLHINIIIMMYSGILVALAVRLVWDPSAYLPVRAIFNDWICGGEGAWKLAILGGSWLGGLVHLAAIAQDHLLSELWRRVALGVWVLGCILAIIGEIIGLRIAYAWWVSPDGERFRQTIDIRRHVTKIVVALNDLNILPTQVAVALDLAEQNVQKLVSLMGIAAIILFMLQLTALGLALKLLFYKPKKPKYHTAYAEEQFYRF